jgi:two-component system chemotaxis response regulator CheB
MSYELVVIGTSAGGLNALQVILSGLSPEFNLPIVIVQHRLPVAEEFMVFALQESCLLKVKEADHGDWLESGRVYLAPANYHLLVERDKHLSLSIDDKVCYSRPSIDVLFETAVDAYEQHLIAIILTGANQDGTEGMVKIKEKGGLTIAQDPQTAEVHIMPHSPIARGVVDKVLSLDEIAHYLNRIVNEEKSHV